MRVTVVGLCAPSVPAVRAVRNVSRMTPFVSTVIVRENETRSET